MLSCCQFGFLYNWCNNIFFKHYLAIAVCRPKRSAALKALTQGFEGLEEELEDSDKNDEWSEDEESTDSEEESQGSGYDRGHTMEHFYCRNMTSVNT